MLRLLFIVLAFMVSGCSEASSNCSKDEILKLIGAGYSKAEIADLCGKGKSEQSTDKKSSAVEGKLFDGNGETVAGTYQQVGKDRKITLSKNGKMFFPSGDVANYTVDNNNIVVGSWAVGTRGKVSRTKLIFPEARGIVSSDLSGTWVKEGVRPQPPTSQEKGQTKSYIRFSKDETTGIISDSKTGLDWLMGPNQNTTYDEAEQFIATIIDFDGGGWRMPTRQELKSLHQNGAGKRTSYKGLREDVFTLSGSIWAGPLDSSEQIDSLWAWVFLLHSNSRNEEYKALRDKSYGMRVLAVRNHPQPQQYVKRFSKGEASSIITDSLTGLDWMVGPDENINYDEAEKWIASLGDGWRMPTRDELRSLYQKGVDVRNEDPAFQVTGWYVWAEPRSSSLAWAFDSNNGRVLLDSRRNSSSNRTFAVRSRPQSSQ